MNLYNYYYLKYPDFATKWLSKLNDYQTFGDFLQFTRNDMINTEKYICEKHNPGEYDYQNNIYLCDKMDDPYKIKLHAKDKLILVSLKHSLLRQKIKYIVNELGI